ncbi:MAG: ribosomal protein S18-alanine N-acetyltransferase [Acholeplasmatales bacterium]|nr:ribosomal protein S18-alanine N-acetyltransferase [Acholeplasmatales bacterium]
MIRRLKEDDILKIVELENSTLNTSLGYDMLKSSLENEMAYFFVLEENEKILGYISTMFDGQIVEILNFCVDNNYQHKGLGTKILAFIDNYFIKLNAESIILEVRDKNINAIKIYEKFGFKKIHVRKNYYSNGDDALILNKKMINLSSLYDSYISVDSKLEKYDDYYKFFDDVQKDKYYNNYFKIINPKKELINELKQKQFRDYLMFFSDIEIDNLFDFKFEKDTLIYMYSSIYGINPLKNNSYDVIKLNASHSKMQYDLVYNDSKEFGLDFANNNALRANDDLINNKFDYFSIIENDKIIAYMKVFKKDDAIFIEDVLTDINYRHKGLCSSIFNYVINYYKNLNVKHVVLFADSDDTTKYMYLDMGFVSVKNCFVYRMV